MSISFPSFAADLSDDGTSVSGEESWSLTAPARLEPGQNGRVTLEGSWPNTRQVSVTSDDSILLVSDLGDYQTLDIYFDGIVLSGSDDGWVSDTEIIGIEDMNALFGTWVGEFYYSIEVFDFDPEQEELEEQADSGEQEEPVDIDSETEEDSDGDENDILNEDSSTDDDLTEDSFGDTEKNETEEPANESENAPEEEPSENNTSDGSEPNTEVNTQSVNQDLPVAEQTETEENIYIQGEGETLQ